MGVYGEVTKFLWFLCDSVREEPDACYIMANEFSAVSIPMLMILEPDWSYQKAQVPFLHTCGSACFCLLLVPCFWRFSRCLFPFFLLSQGRAPADGRMTASCCNILFLSRVGRYLYNSYTTSLHYLLH